MPYILPFIFILPAVFKPRLLGYCIFAVYLSLVAIGALRYDIGFDYLQYQKLFHTDYWFVEPLSNLLFFLTRVFDNALLMFAVFSLLTYSFVCLSSYKSKNLWVLFSYLCLPFYFIESFGLLRQSLAIAICIYAYSLEKTHSKKSYFFVVIACAFHLSALAYFIAQLAYVFLKKIPVYSFFLGSLIFAIITKYFYGTISLIYGKLAFYSGQNTYGEKMFVFCILLFALSFFLPTNKKSKYLFCIALYFSFLSILVDAVYIRFVPYFFIPLLFIDWKISKNNCFKPFVVFFYIIVFMISIYIKSNSSEGAIIPYKTFFLFEAS